MSMIGNFARIPEELRQRLHAAPEIITSVVYADFDGGGSEGDSIPEADQLDVDKAWHAIHFLLTGSAWEGDFPEGFIVSCGQVVGDEDLGYGPARSFSPSETAAIADLLASISDDDLQSRGDLASLNATGIYPEIWDEQYEDDEPWEYVQAYFQTLRAFVVEAKERGLGLLVWLN
ncbi:YfbM family protein [Aeoliella sp. SH292]|uniref:YfbM family protein n=1 Tax=Aeoliella sp. SH292 TaxID=3454464 RepID=UPI003F981D81